MKYSALMVVLSLIVIVVVQRVHAQRPAISQCCEDYCYTSDNEKPQARHYGTKTAYQIGQDRQSMRQGVPNCTPTKVWILSRHGTRLPNAKEMQKLETLSDFRDEIVNNYEKRGSKPDIGALCEGDLDLLRQWKWNRNITTEYDSYLTAQGWDDLKFMAADYQRAFPNVLERVYQPDKFMFQYTQTQRTENSYRAFVEGLFGYDAYKHIHLPPTAPNDTLLVPYKFCPAFEAQDKALDGPDSELSKFMKTFAYQKTIDDVSTRLGFRFPMKSDQLELIWDMCRYEQAWYLSKPSTWCTAFTMEQTKLLEYKEDLKYYYKSGYGSELNGNIACGTVSNMVRFLNSTTGPQSSAYFSHSSMLHLFLVAIGAAKDREALRSDNFDQMKDRVWKTSEIGKFATNIVAVKFDCPNDSIRNKVIFYLNGRPLEFDWCNIGLCNFSDVLAKYKKFTDQNCEKTMCDGNSGSIVKFSVLLLCAKVFLAMSVKNLL